jgi:hypothetical protein
VSEVKQCSLFGQQGGLLFERLDPFGNSPGPRHVGGTGGGVYPVGGGAFALCPIYVPQPEYSEEVRHAKFPGTV